MSPVLAMHTTNKQNLPQIGQPSIESVTGANNLEHVGDRHCCLVHELRKVLLRRDLKRDLWKSRNRKPYQSLSRERQYIEPAFT